MPFRPTHYPNVHDEFYSPAGLSSREKRSIREIGYDMGLKGRRVTREFLDDQAQVYHGRLNSALHTIDQRADIVRHRSGDVFRNASLLILAIGGLVIVGLALTVDFKILQDFWTTIYQNKFLQVPESLKDNVIFKSLQVLFAVLAIHFLISAPGAVGKVIRGLFMFAIGVMVVGMLIGLGFLASKSTLPSSATFNGKPVLSAEAPSVSNEDILQGLGLRGTTASGDVAFTGSTKPTAAQPCDRKSNGARKPKKDVSVACKTELAVNAIMGNLDSTSTVVYFATFSLIFLFVSSVGALCMHYSLRSFNALFGGVSPEHPEHASPTGLHGIVHWALGKGEWRPRTRKDLADLRRRIFHAQVWIGDPGYRERLMQRFFSDFSAGYADGLHDRDANPLNVTGAKFDDLYKEMRSELAEARAEWTAEAIAEQLPSEELRQSLGYNPDERRRNNPFGFFTNLVSGRHRIGEADVIERRRPAEGHKLPPPSSDNVVALSAQRESDSV